MLAGTVLRERELRDTCAGTHRIVVMQPQRTRASREELLATEQRWRRQHDAIPVANTEARTRARFAYDVAFLAAATVIGPDEWPFIVVALENGEVRGISMFRLEGEQTWNLALHTVEPNSQGGNPASCQVRGIGSELLGADADLMLRRLCATVELEPLDDAAERFWRSRGFHNGTGRHVELHMSCPELRTLAETHAHTPHDDEHCHAARRHPDWTRHSVAPWTLPRTAR